MYATLLRLRHSASKLRLGSLPHDSAGIRVASLMSIAAGASVLALPNSVPSIADTAFVAEGARIIGNVSLAAGASVWYNAVLRGDSAGIFIGPDSNVQDNVSVHVDSDHPRIGRRKGVHRPQRGRARLHDRRRHAHRHGRRDTQRSEDRCRVSDRRGAVVLGEAEIPAGSLVARGPREGASGLSDEEREGLIANADIYLVHSRNHSAATRA